MLCLFGGVYGNLIIYKTIKNIIRENRKDADKIKIMWWNPDTGNTPITNTIEIDSASGNNAGKIFTSY